MTEKEITPIHCHDTLRMFNINGTNGKGTPMTPIFQLLSLVMC